MCRCGSTPSDSDPKPAAATSSCTILRSKADMSSRAFDSPVVVTSARDPWEVSAEFVTHVTGLAPSTDELAVLRRATEDVLAAERSA